MTTAGPCTELPVWISGEQRRVTGVDKHTTCVEVIRALVDSLEIADKKKEPQETGPSLYRKYVIVERWRRVERPLEADARILKLWQRWGEEQKHVKLALKKLPNGQYSTTNSKGSGFPRQRSKTSKLSLPLLLHKKSKSSKSTPTVVVPKPGGRNVVRRGSISSGGGNDRKPYYPSANQNVTALDHLRRLVTAQQETLRAQRRHILKTDAAIEAHETQVHLNRVARMGVDYVQEVYLGEDGEANFIEAENEPDWVLYSRLADIRKRLERERARIRELSERIRKQTAALVNNPNGQRTAENGGEDPDVDEILRKTRSELERLRGVTVTQATTLEHNGRTEGECLRLLNEKNACYQRLQAEEAAANAEHERLLQIKRGIEFHGVHILYTLSDGIQRSPKQQGHGQGSWRLWRRRKYQQYQRNPNSPDNNSLDSEENSLDTLV